MIVYKSKKDKSNEKENKLLNRIPDIQQKIFLIIGVLTSLFHLYTGSGIILLSAQNQRGIHLFLILLLCFLFYPVSKTKKSFFWVNILFLVTSITSSMYMLLTWETRIMRIALPDTLEIVMGVIMLICVLEAARRTIGSALPITALIFLLYALLGQNLPGILTHKPYSFSRIISFLYMTTEGIYGIALGISSTFVALFIIFGTLLNESGGGKYFIDFAYALTGKTRGGPAKTAILSSALVGSISGSPIANVVTTGTFTIPLMIKSGYPRHIAAAVEAVSSTGGMIMPPVMGAVAFIMADYLNVPYSVIVKAAIIPAILYYLSVFFIVDLKACKIGIKGLPSSELPKVKETIKLGGHLFIPIILLILFIFIGWSAMKAIFWSIIVLVITSMLKKSTRFNSAKLIDALLEGAKNLIPVATACACAGIVIGIIAMTGLGVRVSSSLMKLSNGSQFLGLILTMFTSLILGMGLPAVAVYLVTTSLNVPALVQMGVPLMSAHFFVFYFGIISTITPPIALTSYAAAGIANASSNKTGISAFLIGITAYIIPYLFVYSPALLMEGSIAAIIYAFTTAVIGVFLVGIAIEGYLFDKVNIAQRFLFFIAGVLLMSPNLFANFICILIIAPIMWFKYTLSRKKKLNL